MLGRNLRFAVIYALGVAANMCPGLQPPMVGRLVSALGAGNGAIGLALGAQFVAYLMAGILIGGAIGRFGVPAVSIFGMILIAATDVSNYFAHTLPWLIFDNLLQGLGMLAVVVSGQVAITTQATTEGSQARALAIWATAPSLGVALGLGLASHFADGADWRLAFAFHAAITAALVLPGLVATKRGAAATEASPRPSALFRETEVIYLSVGLIFLVLGVNGIVSVSPTFLASVHSTTAGEIGTISAAAMLTGILGSVVAGGALSAGWPHRRLLLVMVALAITNAAVLFSGMGGLRTASATLFGWNLAAGALLALVFALLPRVVRKPENIAASTGLLYQFSSVGAILGAPVFLTLASSAHPRILLSGLAVLAMIGMAAFTPVWTRPAAGGLLEAKAGE